MLPVAILDPRERAGREGLIEDLTRRDRRVDVTLVLDDGVRAEACLEPDELVWLGLRRGDIVGVRPLSALPCCDAPALLLSA
ncbi:hypothetical protein DSM104299_02148 [Baekduia alba]|nr:hypothetical protein DSM104299_02148 [Baekduia alba]